jgi:surface carbohydrate biosynthesis protein
MKTIALPIENKVRGLDGKIWLGLNFVKRGYEVLIGPSWEIKPTIDITRPDAYFTKDPGDGNISFIKKLQESNICVCGISPEAALNAKTEFHAENKQQVINTLDAYFAWGTEPSAEIKKNYDNISTKLHITGNPRFDLLTDGLKSVYAASGTEIKDTHGDFILINTNFSRANPFDLEQLIQRIRENKPGVDIPGERRLSLRILYLFLELVLYLSAENIDHDIILRPHPGEDHSTYVQLFDQYENVRIKHEGDVRSWIYASNGVIHHDCTTGVEAALMGTPVVSYQPLSGTETDSFLSQTVSQTEMTRNGIKNWITESATAEGKYHLTDYQRTQLRRYFPNIDELAAPQICHTVDELLADSSGFSGYEVSTQQRIERRIKSSTLGTYFLDIYDYGRDIIDDGDNRKSRAKQRQKFPGLGHVEISNRIDEMLAHVGMSDIIIKSVPLTRHTYRIKPTD